MSKQFQDNKEDLRSALILFARLAFDNEQLYSKVAKVISVNDSEATVKAEIVDGAIMEDIRLNQVESSLGLLIKPKVGSMIIITFTDNVTAFVSTFSEIDGIIFQNGVNEGLVKVVELTSNINERETRLNDIVIQLTALATAATATGTAPVTGASLGTLITNALAPIITPITPTTKEEIQNDKFTH